MLKMKDVSAKQPQMNATTFKNIKTLAASIFAMHSQPGAKNYAGSVRLMKYLSPNRFIVPVIWNEQRENTVAMEDPNRFRF